MRRKWAAITFGGLVLLSLLGLLLAQMIVAAPPLPHTLLGEVKVAGSTGDGLKLRVKALDKGLALDRSKLAPLSLTEGSSDTTDGEGAFIFAVRDDDPDTPDVREGGRPDDRLFFFIVTGDGTGDAITKRLQVIDDDKDVDILLKAADSPPALTRVQISGST